MDNAVELRGVGKRYTKYDDTPMLLTSALRFRRRTTRAKLWAVRGVDLDVPRGTTYGIIGRNGSGKTTLLSMMAGVTAPTEGSVRAWGRIAPLISVGVGFHRELTGRENVYLNGTILGLTRSQIDERLESIVDFAEISGFLDTPVKFYSSGMYVRLGFSVAVHSEPELLLVDEVLAVGDLGFQMKCYRRMHSLQENGTTIVVISHNLTALQRMCDQILVLNRGRPVYLGRPSEAIAEFHALLEAEPTTEAEAISTGTSFEPGVVRIASVELLGPAGSRVSEVETGTPLEVRMVTEAERALDDVTVGFALMDAQGQLVYTETTANRSLGPVAVGQQVSFTLSVPARLPTGSYSIVALVQRRDLRVLFAQSRPIPFYVTGRVTVGGAADLGGVIERHDVSPVVNHVAAGRPAEPAIGSVLGGEAGEPAVPRTSS